jgi:hypothetical protein
MSATDSDGAATRVTAGGEVMRAARMRSFRIGTSNEIFCGNETVYAQYVEGVNAAVWSRLGDSKFPVSVRIPSPALDML